VWPCFAGPSHSPTELPVLKAFHITPRGNQVGNSQGNSRIHSGLTTRFVEYSHKFRNLFRFTLVMRADKRENIPCVSFRSAFFYEQRSSHQHRLTHCSDVMSTPLK